MTWPVDNLTDTRATYRLKARIVQANGFHAPESRCCGQGMAIGAQALCRVLSAIRYLVANAMRERFMTQLMNWTDDRVEQLKNLWTEGLSASQIARALGGVTRNAVIGKLSRLNLTREGNGEAREG